MTLAQKIAGWLRVMAATSLLMATSDPASGEQRLGGSAVVPGWGTTVEIRPSGTQPSANPTKRPRAAPESAGHQAPAGKPRQQPRKGATSGTAANMAVGFSIEGDATRTILSFDLANPTEAIARSVSNPPRVIVDVPEIEFRLPPGTGQTGQGLVTAFRYGLIVAGKSRIVIDTATTARVDRAEIVLTEAAGVFRLEIEMSPISAGALAAMELVEATHALRPTIPETHASEPRTGLPDKPVIVVDAGHGGIDSGAVGSQIEEKELVLRVARRIGESLQSTRRYEVVMTRNSDVFLSLDERVAMSQRHNADLFISVHADSLASRELAQSVRGATVYTLSEQASDDLSRRKADKENAVDLLAGLPATTVGDEQVRSILLDLMRRESHNFSFDFRRTLVDELRSRILLSRDGMRSAPFKVLRQPGAPAVLVELGYISNQEDERIMLTPDWQGRVAAAVTRAVDAHFQRRQALQR